MTIVTIVAGISWKTSFRTEQWICPKRSTISSNWLTHRSIATHSKPISTKTSSTFWCPYMQTFWTQTMIWTQTSIIRLSNKNWIHWRWNWIWITNPWKAIIWTEDTLRDRLWLQSTQPIDRWMKDLSIVVWIPIKHLKHRICIKYWIEFKALKELTKTQTIYVSIISGQSIAE